jgi:hypothetical protein
MTRKPRILSEETKAKKRARYAANREAVRAEYAANKDIIRSRRRDNKETRRLEEGRIELFDIQKSTKSLEIKQFINLIVGSPELYNITKESLTLLRTIANDFPYTNGSTEGVHSALDVLRVEAEALALTRGRFLNEIIYDNDITTDERGDKQQAHIMEREIGDLFRSNWGEISLSKLDTQEE